MSTTKNKIDVAIIDDQQLIIDGLISLLHNSEEVEVVGYTTDGLNAYDLIKSNHPQVLLLDYRFPDLNTDGIEIATLLLSHFPSLKILMLTSYDEITLIKEALKKGLKGYLLKNTDKSELIYAIKKVAGGHSYLGPNVQRKIINIWEKEEPLQQSASSSDFKPKVDHPLTKRELEIARLYSNGKSRKEIAEELFISTNTVDTHLKNTFGKLNVKNVAELIKDLLDRQLL
ncbi:MAG: response regulator transcription factor [Bacteroidota bacterium]